MYVEIMTRKPRIEYCYYSTYFLYRMELVDVNELPYSCFTGGSIKFLMG